MSKENKYELSKREEYILNYFYPKYFEIDKSVEIVKRISSLGSRTGFVGNQGSDSRRKHKYDTWIAKIVKDDLERLKKAKKPLNISILDNEIEFRNILDWMIAEKIDAFQYNYKQALEQQEIWHQSIAENMQIDKIDIPELDESRIIYRCKNQKYFFYLLNKDDLKYEGVNMGHCVGGTNYQNNVANNRSIIFSLRDNNNKPHVTTEIIVSKENGELKGVVSQCQGKPNNSEGLSRKPKDKYLEMIQEFVLFACDFYDDEILKFMNKNYF